MVADVYEEGTAQTTAGRREKQASIKVFPVLEGYIKHGSLYRTRLISYYRHEYPTEFNSVVQISAKFLMSKMLSWSKILIEF